MAVEVGSAVLAIFPSAKGMRSKLEQQVVPDASAVGDKAGEASGHHFVARFAAIAAGGIALGLGLLLKGVVAGLKATVGPASDLNETMSKSAVIFGQQAAAVSKWASTSATAMGLTKQQAVENAASFGDMFAQLKIGPERARNMSTSIVQLGADLASFHNADITDVLQAESAAFRGEFDSIQRFVPAINAARVQAEALRITHKKSAKDLTDADKALATYNILTHDTTAAQGDFARTSTGLANQQRILSAQWGDLKARIGTALLPAVIALTTSLNTKLMPALNELWSKHGAQVTAWLDRATAKVGPFVDKLASLDFAGLGINVGAVAAKLRELSPELSKVGGAAGSGFVNTLQVGGTVMKFLADHADLLAKALPFLAAAFLAVKVAQASETTVALIRLPLRFVELAVHARTNAVLRAHTAALVANMVAQTAALGPAAAETAATNVGFFARVRAAAGLVGYRVAMIATTVATAAWTAVQWLLNVALTANPIGIIIVAIGALVAAILFAWFHSAGFRNFLIGAWNAIWNVLKAVGAWFAGPFAGFFVRTYQAVVNATRMAVDWVKTKWNEFLVFFIQLPFRVIAALGNLRDRFLSVGSSIIEGIMDGIRNVAGHLVDLAVNAVKNALNAMKKFLHITSPSSVAARVIGRPFGEGVAMGIEQSADGIAAAVGRLLPAGAAGAGAFGPAGLGAPVVGTMNVNGSPGQSPLELAALVRRELAWTAEG